MGRGGWEEEQEASVSQSSASCPTWGADATPPRSLWWRSPGRTGPLPGSLFSHPTCFHLRCLSRLSSHPSHLSSSNRVLPGSVRNCSWRSRGTPKPANGKRRDAEIGNVDGKVGGKESGGAGLSIKVTWG